MEILISHLIIYVVFMSSVSVYSQDEEEVPNTTIFPTSTLRRIRNQRLSMLRNYVLETLGFSSPPRMNQSIHDTLAIISQYQSQRIRESRCYLPSCKCHRFEGLWGLGVMVFNATFNNISVISWRSVLLVGETGVPGENHRSAASH